MAANKTIYLNLEPHMISPESGATVQVKLDDEGIVAEAWSLDDCIAATNYSYDELGIEVKEIKYLDTIAEIDIEIAACEQAIIDAYIVRDVDDLKKRIQELSRKRKELIENE